MSQNEEAKVKFQISNTNEQDQPRTTGFSNFETERTRTFQRNGTIGSAQAGSIHNANWLIKYKADGDGRHC